MGGGRNSVEEGTLEKFSDAVVISDYQRSNCSVLVVLKLVLLEVT